MSTPSLKDKQVGEELLTDAGRYPAHRGCKAVLAVVYDPERMIKSPAGLAANLSEPTAAGVPMRTIVVFKLAFLEIPRVACSNVRPSWRGFTAVPAASSNMQVDCGDSGSSCGSGRGARRHPD